VLEENLKRLETPVLRTVTGRLFGENIRLPAPDIEAAYNQAWHGIYHSILEGATVENLMGLLVSVTYMRAIDAYRLRHEGQQADTPLDGHLIELDLAETVDTRQKIDGLIARLVKRLNQKERMAVTLCVLHGYPRAVAAERLGMPERAFQKVMDSATKKMGGVVETMQTKGCDEGEWARAVRSYAIGTMDESSPDYDRITRHLAECAACKRYVNGLRGLAAVLPPILPFAHDPTAMLAHLHRLFAPVHPATGATITGGSAAPPTLSTAGVTAAASSTGAGGSGGLASVLGSGGFVKAAILTGTVLTSVAGVATVHAITKHHATPPQPRVVQSYSDLQTPLAKEPGLSHLPVRVARSSIPKQKHASPTRPRGSSATGSASVGSSESHEFGFEHQTPSSSTNQAASPSASSISTSEAGSGEEFGLPGG
jgi:DNA-directed RNA polymerase specialized sigma24 family protein